MGKKKLIKPVGDQLSIKKTVKSLWEPVNLSDLKSVLSDRLTPYSPAEKLELSQFGFGRNSGEKANKQLYPTRFIVIEIDTPPPHKGMLNDEDIFNKWSKEFIKIYNEIRKEDGIKYWIMYLTPSMCGIRFIIKVAEPVNDEQEYKKVALLFLKNLQDHGVKEAYYDIKVNSGWYLPTFTRYYNERKETYPVTPMIKDNKQTTLIERAITFTERKVDFKEGNRNNFIHLLANNANRLGVLKEKLLALISKSEYAYDMVEIETTLNSAYKNTIDFGKWSENVQEDDATVSLKSLLRKAKDIPPIPLIWSGIKEGSLGFIFGLAKTGKSTLCECLAFSISSGLDNFMGMPIISKDTKVLYISMEEIWQLRTERNRLQEQYLFKKYHKKLDNNFITNTEKYPRYILNDSDLKFIEGQINKHEPNIVFIDSLTHLIIDKVEDSSRTSRMMSKLRTLCDNTGATFIIIHHTIKMKDKHISLVDMAGSRVLAQEADFLIGVNQAPNGQRYLKEVSFRHKSQMEKVIPFDINEFRWIISGEPIFESDLFSAGDGRKDDTNKLAILDFIKTIEGQVSISDIKEQFNSEMSKKTIHNNLNKLLTEDKIEKVEKGIYKCSVENSKK
jgi:archaellum biogenesis ATPase FlaH